MNAINTNVLVYSLDDNEKAKQAKAQALLGDLAQSRAVTVLPWQVAGELLNWLRKWEIAGRVSRADCEAHFHNFLAMFPLAMPDSQAFLTYFDLLGRFSLSHWDAMLLAACKIAGVTQLFSEDLDSKTDYDGLTVMNPFE